MRVSPKLKYPLVAGMGMAMVRVTAATRAANIAPAAMIIAALWAPFVWFMVSRRYIGLVLLVCVL